MDKKYKIVRYSTVNDFKGVGQESTSRETLQAWVDKMNEKYPLLMH